MKIIDQKEIKERGGKIVGPQDTFTFRCHPDLACFNRCCRNLNLYLYPYDVVRLKKQLGMTSDQFLDAHVDMVMRPGNFFPAVLLRMREDEEKTCPFLTDSGCRVYPDRPDACRTFPVEMGLHYDNGEVPRQVYFFRPPDFCLGQHEPRELRVEEWVKDQEAEAYHRMTRRWAEVKALFHKDPWGSAGPEGPAAKMAFMSTYNLDRFRDFILKSSFLSRYKVPPEVLSAVAEDDTALMELGFEWVKLFVWGIETPKIKMIGQ